MAKLKVLFIDGFGNSKKVEMSVIPSVDDVVPVFHSKGCVVVVCWFPELLNKDLAGHDVLITLS